MVQFTLTISVLVDLKKDRFGELGIVTNDLLTFLHENGN